MRQLIRKRNPFIYDYGYHFTSNESEIISIGFRNLTKNDYLYYKILYNSYHPIYFATLPYTKYISTQLSHYLNRYRFIIKVNVKNLDQKIDFYSLLEPRFNIVFNYSNVSLENNSNLNQYPLLNNWFNIYKGKIPLEEFNKNKKLTSDFIITTQTFCIAENIPPKNIVDIYEIKK